jgi:hypothetical protein
MLMEATEPRLFTLSPNGEKPSVLNRTEGLKVCMSEESGNSLHLKLPPA